MVEIDLQCTRDGGIVVLHDATLDRLWGVPQRVKDLDLDQLAEIGRPGVGIPTLREVLHRVDIPLMVDFTGAEVVEGALEAVRDAGAMGRALFVTAHVGALHQLRALAPEARVGLTWIEREPPPPSLLDELGAEYWNPMFRLVDSDRVRAVHDLGLKVSTWTVDEPRHMARVAAAGVDAIVSNRIGALRRFLT
jgi:glycerophosphoryl diester phosphodiesterase